MKKCVIVGGADIGNFNFVNRYISDDDYIIYCDSGLYHMDKLSGKTGLIIGDFDSHPEPDMDVETIKLPVEKDDTDTVYAVKEAILRGYTNFTLVGVLGRRLDHSLGNLAILLYLQSKGLSGMIVDDYSEITVIAGTEEVLNESIDIEPTSLSDAGSTKPEKKCTDSKTSSSLGYARIQDNCKYFSLLCAGGPAEGISISGAKYNLENADLTMEFPLGVSNEVLPGGIAEVTLKKGRLFLIKIMDKDA